jgi:predicted transcriptional regulator
MNRETVVTLTADIVAAHVANNTVGIGDIGNLVQQVHQALEGLGAPAEEAPQAKVPVVSVRASVKPDYIVCMECGKKQKTLKRHLQTAHGMSPEEYRKDYGLPRDYPMVAPNYSQRRSEMAQAIGLGQRGKKRSGSGSKGGGEEASGGVVGAMKSAAKAAANAVTGGDSAGKAKRSRKGKKAEPQSE